MPVTPKSFLAVIASSLLIASSAATAQNGYGYGAPSPYNYGGPVYTGPNYGNQGYRPNPNYGQGYGPGYGSGPRPSYGPGYGGPGYGPGYGGPGYGGPGYGRPPVRSNFSGPWANTDNWRPNPRNPFRDRGMKDWIKMDKDTWAENWEDMLNSPSRMGDVGGWEAPYIGVPNPIDVGDELEDAATSVPGQMRDIPDNFDMNYNR